MAGTSTIRNAPITNLNDQIIPIHAASSVTDQDQRPDMLVPKIQGGNESDHITNDHSQQYRSIINTSYPQSSSPMTTTMFHPSHYQSQGGMMMLPTMQSSSGDLNRNMMPPFNHQMMISPNGITRFHHFSGGLADQHQHHQDIFTQFSTNFMPNGRSTLSEDPQSTHNSQSIYQFHPYNNTGPSSYHSSTQRYGCSLSTMPQGMIFPMSPFHSPLELTDLPAPHPEPQYMKHINDADCCSPSALMQAPPMSDDSNQSNIISIRDQSNQGWMMMYADTVDGQFYCRICPNSRLFNSKATLKKHIQYCHAEKPQCPYCKAGIRADNMSRHIKRYCPKAGYKNAIVPVPHRGQQPRYSMEILKNTGSSILDKTSDAQTVSSQGQGMYNQDAWDDHKSRIEETNTPMLKHNMIHETEKPQSRKGSNVPTEDHGCDTSLDTLSFLAADREKNPGEDMKNRIDQKQDQSVTLPSIVKGDIIRKDVPDCSNAQDKGNVPGYPSRQYTPGFDMVTDSQSIQDETSRFTSFPSNVAMTSQHRQFVDYYQQHSRNVHTSNSSTPISKGADSNSFQQYSQNLVSEYGQFQPQNWNGRSDRAPLYMSQPQSTLNPDFPNLPPLFQLSISPNSSYEHQVGGLSSWTSSGPSQLSSVVTLGNGSVNRQFHNTNMELAPQLPASYQQYAPQPPTMIPRYTMKPATDFISTSNQQNIDGPTQSHIVFEQRNVSRANTNNAAISGD